MNRIGSPQYMDELDHMLNNLIAISKKASSYYPDNRQVHGVFMDNEINAIKEDIKNFISPAISQVISLRVENERLNEKLDISTPKTD